MIRNKYVEEWHDHEAELTQVREAEFARMQKAIAAGDYDVGNMTVGESIGLVHDVPTARDVLERTIAEATAAFNKFDSLLAA